MFLTANHIFGLSNTIIHHYLIVVNKKLLTTMRMHAILCCYDEMQQKSKLVTQDFENRIMKIFLSSHNPQSRQAGEKKGGKNDKNFQGKNREFGMFD